VLKGQPDPVDSTCPRWGEKASYYSAVCLETGETEHMDLTGTSSSATSATFLRQLRANHPEPLIVIWDNGPAHGVTAVRDYLATPDLGLRVLRLPADSPDCNPDEAIWAWAPRRRCRSGCSSSSPASASAPPRSNPAAAASCRRSPRRSTARRPRHLRTPPM